MFSYEFITKKDRVGFSCLDQPYIWIDKEDMVRVLSAEGYWFQEKNSVFLKNHHHNSVISLENYLLNAPLERTRQIQRGLNFKKDNILILKVGHSPYFFRPFSLHKHRDLSHFPFSSHPFLYSYAHTVTYHQKVIGYIYFVPVPSRVYQDVITRTLSHISFPQRALSYENDSIVSHLIYTSFSLTEEILPPLLHYYEGYVNVLALRSIHIKESFLYAPSFQSLSTCHCPYITEWTSKGVHITL